MSDVINAGGMQTIEPTPVQNDQIADPDIIGTYTAVFQDSFFTGISEISITGVYTGSSLSALSLTFAGGPPNWETNSLTGTDPTFSAVSGWYIADVRSTVMLNKKYIAISYTFTGTGGDLTPTGIWLGVSPPPPPPCPESPHREPGCSQQ